MVQLWRWSLGSRCFTPQSDNLGGTGADSKAKYSFFLPIAANNLVGVQIKRKRKNNRRSRFQLPVILAIKIHCFLYLPFHYCKLRLHSYLNYKVVSTSSLLQLSLAISK
ncbi:hypothetical protein L2E82_47072 [Cichorium intybus]|uniref:Uncharacterized protein n=1 Tax=Cichorium intybus TaxID=13427 RepID=A0ACB8YV01_CICIN|nr:hypothetical protein L2E82_47072 [Cichorium intybus]